MPSFKSLRAAVVALGLVSGGLYFLEGNNNTVYLDGGHYATVCRGVRTNLPVGTKLTDEQCKQLNAAKEQEFLKVVHKYITVPLSPEREAALVWFAYNIGETGFKTSHAVKLINQGKTEAGCKAIMNWNHINGVPDPGLTNRRGYEEDYCSMGLQTAKDKRIWDFLD